MSLTIVYIELFILILGIIILVALFVFRTAPYNKPYEFRDPRTWKSVPSNQSWLISDFDYSPYNRDVPDVNIKAIYCADTVDPTRCISSNIEYKQKVPTPPRNC
jgi:hypothetical protein